MDPSAYCVLYLLDVLVDPCEYGLPRCPHCTAESTSACDDVAVTQECQNSDVSKYWFWHLTAINKATLIIYDIAGRIFRKCTWKCCIGCAWPITARVRPTCFVRQSRVTHKLLANLSTRSAVLTRLRVAWQRYRTCFKLIFCFCTYVRHFSHSLWNVSAKFIMRASIPGGGTGQVPQVCSGGTLISVCQEVLLVVCI